MILFYRGKFSRRANILMGSPLFLPRQTSLASIDCWRVFEAHWLSLQGQPQFAALQCVLAHPQHSIDTFVLKELLLDLNQQRFLNVGNVIAFLTKQALSAGVDAQWAPFMPSLGPPELSSLPGHFTHYPTVRFLCHTSSQPFTGEVQLLLPEALDDHDRFNWLLLDRRSQAFDPVGYTDSLFRAVLSWGLPCLLSVHLARRGGISYQGLRWHEQPFIDPQSLIQLSCVE